MSALPTVGDDVLALESDVELTGEVAAGPTLASRAVQFTAADISAAPPPRQALLTDSRTSRPVLLKGIVALYGAKGGIGKTITTLQLAASVATGTQWLNTFTTGTPGRVLMLAAEEDEPELLRRMHFTCRAMNLTDAQRELVAQNITYIPLAGVGVALTHGATNDRTGALLETNIPEEIREMLRAAEAAGRPYVLAVLDPLSRFEGPDAEVDNVQATRLVQVCESFCTPACGRPTILVPHHLRKGGADDVNVDLADLFRGASGLINGVRLALVLLRARVIEGAPEILSLQVAKANNVAFPAPLALCRPADGEGVVRAASPADLATYAEMSGKRTAAKLETIDQGVFEVLSKLSVTNPGERFGVEPVAKLFRAASGKARSSAVGDALTRLAAAGRIDRNALGAMCPPRAAEEYAEFEEIPL